MKDSLGHCMNWIEASDVINILKLSDYEIIRALVRMVRKAEAQGSV